MELSTIGYFIIAFVTLIFILSFVTGKLSPSSKKAYCSLLRGVRMILPLPPSFKPTLPIYCQENITILETKTIESSDPAYVAKMIAAYIVACWEKTGKINIGHDVACFELILSSGVDKPGVSSSDVESILLDEGYPIFISWFADSPLTRKTSIVISYNAKTLEIEVR